MFEFESLVWVWKSIIKIIPKPHNTRPNLKLKLQIQIRFSIKYIGSGLAARGETFFTVF